jgi:hypothetical protein
MNNIFQKVLALFKNGQKKCPKSKTQFTFWKKYEKSTL